MKNSIIVLIAAVFLWSCQKDITGGEPGSGPTGGGKLIAKHTHQIDQEVWIDSFSYDQQNRCTEMKWIYIDSSAPGSSPQEDFFRFHYNGNDALPFKISDTNKGRNLNWYLFYDGQKRVSRDSIVNAVNGDLTITRYAYSGNRLVANTSFRHSTGTDTWIDTLESDGTNYLRRSSDYAYANFFPQIIATYDNQPGAFTNLNITPLFIGGVTQLGDFYQRSRNNPITAEYSTRTSSNKFFYTIAYTYGPDGYPVASTWTIAGGLQRETEKFEYKK